jgi:hypothetical protein
VTVRGGGQGVEFALENAQTGEGRWLAEWETGCNGSGGHGGNFKKIRKTRKLELCCLAQKTKQSTREEKNGRN